MTHSPEHRLLFYTVKQINAQRKKAGASQISGKPTRQVVGYETSTEGNKTPIIRSAAEANKSLQDAARQNSLAAAGANVQPVAAPFFQSPYTQQPITPTTATNPNTGKTYTGAAAGRLQGRLQGDYATQQEEIKNLKGYDQIPQYDEQGNLTGYDYQENPQKSAELQAQAAATLEAKVEADRSFTQGQRDQTQANLEGVPDDLKQAYQPTIDAASGAAKAAGTEYGIAKQELAAEAKTAEEQKAAEEAGALETYNDRLAFNEKRDTLARDREEETKRSLLAENQTSEEIMKLENQRAERLLRDQNIDQELQNRRLAAKLGINHDTGGLQWMQEEARKGEESLAFLMQRNALTTKEFADQRIDIMNAYNLDMRQIDLDAAENYDTAYRAYQSEKSAIKKDYLAGVKDRRTALKESRQRYFDNLTESDYKKAEAYRDARLKMLDLESEAEDRAAKYEDRLLAREERAMNAMERNEDQSKSSMLMEMNRLNTRLNNDPILKPYNEQKMKFMTVDADYQRTLDNFAKYKNGELDKQSMNFLDQGLINGINKMWDENSVVRESEYARSPAGMSMKNRLEAWVSNKLNGGILNDAERSDLKAALDTMFGVWTTQADTALDKFYLQINKVNSTLLPQHYLTPEDFGLSNITGSGQKFEQVFDDAAIDAILNGEVTPEELSSVTINGRQISAQPVVTDALAQVDAEMKAELGFGIDVVEAYRSAEKQQIAYDRYLAGEIAAAAPPGKSLHGKGLAIDIKNYEKARPYLLKYGFKQFDTKKDPGHFSYQIVG